MRKLLVGIVTVVAAGAMGQIAGISNAWAADLPMMTKAPVLTPSYDWSGFYAGGQVGGGWYKSQTTDLDGTAAFPTGTVFNPVNGSGILGGGYAGFNYEANRMVIGIDGDYSWANLNGSEATVGPTGFTSSANSKVSWIATVAARVGYAANNFLYYGKFGGAWAGFSSNGVTTNPAGIAVTNTGSSDTRNGFTVGAGVEWGFASNWSAKLEYDYVTFGTTNFSDMLTSVATGVVTTPARSAISDLHMVKVGFSYRFNPRI
jgi:outer membrane immunogenic protein